MKARGTLFTLLFGAAAGAAWPAFALLTGPLLGVPGALGVYLLAVAVALIFFFPFRKIFFYCGFDFSSIFTQFRWNPLHSKFVIDIFFCFTCQLLFFTDGFAYRKNTIFTNLTSFAFGYFSNFYIMLLRSRKIYKRCAKTGRIYNTKIYLRPFSQRYTGFSRTFCYNGFCS